MMHGMKPYRLTSTLTQAAALHAGATLIVVPITPQPSHMRPSLIHPLPFRDGQTIEVREPWALPSKWNSVGAKNAPSWAGCWWEADSSRPLSEGELKWRPARTMPPWAVRTRLIAVGDPEPRLVREIGESEAAAAGFTEVLPQRCGSGLKPMNDGTLCRQHFRGAPPLGWAAIKWAMSDYDPLAITAKEELEADWRVSIKRFPYDTAWAWVGKVIKWKETP